MPKIRAKIPREPRGPTLSYLRTLRRVYGTVQGFIAYGLSPLLDLWPEERTDRASRETGTGIESAYPFRPRSAYSPLAPRPRVPRIWNLSDRELRDLWPGIPPQDIRDRAPWATSRAEVRRVAGPGDPEEYVRAAIARTPVVNPVAIVDPRRPPRAFRLRPRDYAPTVLDSSGFPLVPPRPTVLSTEVLREQLAWVNLGTSEILTVENIANEIRPAGQQLDLFNRRELRRVLSIDPREIPGVEAQLQDWLQRNVDLIGSGVRGGVLPQVEDLVQDAWTSGTRVEVLAHDIVGRFGVSTSRAERIARDQTLKLNSELNRYRQLDAGVEEYIWDTAGDERVRESHAALDGTRQSWRAPPSVGHPGTEWQCRCVAIPVI